jgi:hypothetical protein
VVAADGVVVAVMAGSSGSASGAETGAMCGRFAVLPMRRTGRAPIDIAADNLSRISGPVPQDRSTCSVAPSNRGK